MISQISTVFYTNLLDFSNSIVFNIRFLFNFQMNRLSNKGIKQGKLGAPSNKEKHDHEKSHLQSIVMEIIQTGVYFYIYCVIPSKLPGRLCNPIYSTWSIV